MNYKGLSHIAAFSVIVILSCLSVLSSCGGNSPTDPANGDDGHLPNGDGVLLEGNPSDPAIDALTDLPPTPAPSDEVDSSGFISSRVSAFLSPAATVQQVNDLLNHENARIIGMYPGVQAVWLKVDPLASRAAADSLCERLAADTAFVLAIPSIQVRPNGPNDLPSGTAGINISHFDRARIPAAWNLRGAVSTTSYSVLVPDFYYTLNRHGDISNQRHASLAGLPTTDIENGRYVGNHGFHVTGIIGADWDGDEDMGVHPDPDKLDLVSIAMDGTDPVVDMQSIARYAPSFGNFLINTSLGYSDPTFSRVGKFDRIALAMLWRSIAVTFRDRCFHGMSSGNDGTVIHSVWNSSFCTSASLDDLSTLIATSSLPAARQAQLQNLWNGMLAGDPQVALRPPGAMIVGSSDATGAESNFSMRPSDVRMEGELVSSVCVQADPVAGCDGTRALYSGTSFAAPQVVGLAAYLWSLEPSLTALGIKDRIKRGYSNSANAGVVDGYQLVLGLDPALGAAKMRQHLLDVAGISAAPGSNKSFDENDLALCLAKFEEYENQRILGGNVRDYSRYDLNGDGFTGGETYRSKFDLDVNNPPQFGKVSQSVGTLNRSFDENDLTDYEILCYYAFSSLYSGNLNSRDMLLTECLPSVTLLTEFPAVVYPNTPASLVVKAVTIAGTIAPRLSGDESYEVLVDTTYLEGLELRFYPTDGSVTSATGLTDASGTFTNSAIIDPGAASISVQIVGVANDTEVARATAEAINGAGLYSITQFGFTAVAEMAGNAGFDSQIETDTSLSGNNLNAKVSGSYSDGNGDSFSGNASSDVLVTVQLDPQTNAPTLITYSSTLSSSLSGNYFDGPGLGGEFNARSGLSFKIEVSKGLVEYEAVGTIINQATGAAQCTPGGFTDPFDVQHLGTCNDQASFTLIDTVGMGTHLFIFSNMAMTSGVNTNDVIGGTNDSEIFWEISFRALGQ